MRTFLLTVCLLLLTTLAFGQGAAGTITGTVTDPSGAVIPNATIAIHNTANGQTYTAVSTETGNYTVPQLPVGTYDLSVTVAGFKVHNRPGLDLAAAQTMRIDVPLEIGANGEAVTVTAEASLLKTESGDLTHNVTVGQLNTLPVLTIGGGGGTNTNGFRDPLGVALIIPGTQYAANSRMVVNGDPSGTIQQRIEGQTSGQTGSLASFTGMGQASVEAIQEVAVQTSNYVAEYGAVGGAIFNVTMKSGTNQYHGSAYDYAVNEALNAHQPYTGLRSPTKRHDYGGTIGGPIRIPKVYNGTNKSFFFFGFEQFREDIRITSVVPVPTVPIDPYRIGNFQQVITGSGNLPIQVGGKNYIDPTGRTGILSGTIFDPTTQQTVRCNTTAVPGANCSNGSDIQVRSPFPNNQVPSNYFDPVSLKILKLVPEPTGPNFLNGQVGGNYQNPFLSSRRSEIPSIKLDHTFSASQHTSFYYQETATGVKYTTPNGVADGLPEPITGAIGSYAHTYTYRLSHDWSIRPTMLLHLGAGWFHNNFDTHAGTIDYNATTQLGLTGATVNRTFPNIIVGSAGTATGGMNNLGPLNQSTAGTERRPSGVASVTWVKASHTYKLGGEWRGERYPAQSFTGTAGSYTFGSNSTQQTALQSITTSQGSTGFPFASFLMGDVTAYSLSLPTAVSTGKQQWGLYLQDSWKLTRNLTFDYGVRWDYGGYARERWGRNSNFSETVANPSADNHPGGQIFEATCHCNFASNYPYAIGPRLGVAYKINNKTVLRSGFGIVYTATGFVGGNASNTASGGTPGFGQWLGQLQNGMPASVQPQWPVYTPNVGQAPGSVVGGPAFLDPNAGRPARQYQWSLSLQREINKDLVVEASYVGNRGVWWPAGALGAFNVTSVADLTRYGFTVGNLNDATLLSRQIGQLTQAQKTTLSQMGINLPYASFPTTQTVRASLLPFPQYTSTFAPTLAPLGKTWYDALQVTVTKRTSHGLSLNANYTYSKNLDLMSSPDIFNRNLGKDLSANDLPHQFRLTAEYVTPRTRDKGLGVLSNKFVSYAVSDWGLGWYMQYQSAGILARPATNTTNPISLWLGRGPGSAQLIPGMSPWSVNWTDYSGKVHTDPLDINCRCYDPTKTIVLNPAAWTNVPDGQWAAQTSSIRDYRGYRAPTENANLNRNFRIGKEGRVQLNIRGEFQNVFNRTRLPNPVTTGFQSKPTTQSSGTYAGLYNGGFGAVVPISGTAGSRTGTLIARLTF